MNFWQWFVRAVGHRMVYWKPVIWTRLVRTLAAAYVVVGIITVIREDLITHSTDAGVQHGIGKFPAWSFASWVDVGLVTFIVFMLEGSYRQAKTAKHLADSECNRLLSEMQIEACTVFTQHDVEMAALKSHIHELEVQLIKPKLTVTVTKSEVIEIKWDAPQSSVGLIGHSTTCTVLIRVSLTVNNEHRVSTKLDKLHISLFSNGEQFMSRSGHVVDGANVLTEPITFGSPVHGVVDFVLESTTGQSVIKETFAISIVDGTGTVWNSTPTYIPSFTTQPKLLSQLSLIQRQTV